MAEEKMTATPEAPGSEKPIEGNAPEAAAPEVTAAPSGETPETAEKSEPSSETPPGEEHETEATTDNLGPPVPGGDGEVVVDFDKISELIAQRNAAAREAVERRAAEEPEGADDPGRPKADKETPEAPEAEAAPKRRGRKPKTEKTEQAAEQSRQGHKPKEAGKDKAAPAGKARDKVSRGKRGKGAPEHSSPGGGASEAPTVEGGSSAGDTTPPATVVEENTAPPRPVEDQKVVYLKISEMHPFHTYRQHPFSVRDDAKMQETVASIKLNGVMVPGLARPEKDGNGYEIIAGHRRCRGSELSGLDEMPFIVREMTDHEAVQAMKDSNKQRDGMLPMEMARLLDLEMEDIKHQGVALKNVPEGDIGKRSAEIVGEAHGMNYKKVMRYIRLNSLVPELQDIVDGTAVTANGDPVKKLGFIPAVELSYIRPKNQQLIAVSIEGEQTSPSVSQAKKLRELDQQDKLTGDVIDAILCEEKKEVGQVIISTEELGKYFG